MWYAPSVIAAAGSESLTVDEVKARLRVDGDDSDWDLASMIVETRDHVEKYCNILLSQRDLELKCDSFADLARLPLAPAIETLTITYLDLAGEEVLLPADAYEDAFGEFEGAILLRPGQSWPATLPSSRITVRLRAGYEKLPGAIRRAMLLHIGDANERRENGSEASWTAFDCLLANYRRGI